MRKKNPIEQLLKQGLRQQRDDKSIVNVGEGDEATGVIKRERQIEWVNDPNTGIRTPITTSVTTYGRDEFGRPFSTAANAGRCRLGCHVRVDSLCECSLCHQSICRRHSIIVSNYAFCRKRPCNCLARPLQVCWYIYRVVRFCVKSVLGFDTSDDSRSEVVYYSPDRWGSLKDRDDDYEC